MSKTGAQQIYQRPIAVLAAGGSGGHLTPAKMIGDALRVHEWEVVVFTDIRGKSHASSDFPFPLFATASATNPRGLVNKALAAGKITLGVYQAVKLLRRIRPQLVLGFGGYPSFPAAFAARLLGIPLALHEQNTVMGRANRMLAKMADTIYCGFDSPRLTPKAAEKKLVTVGNPVPRSLKSMEPPPTLSETSRFNLTVYGGSQGAKIFSDVVPAAIARLPQDFRRRIDLVQQCRDEDRPWVEKQYRDIGFQPTALTPYIQDLPARLKDTHLAICRSGAGTVSWLMAAGRKAIFVPLPVSLDGDQLWNARYACERGYGWLVEQPQFTADMLSSFIGDILSGSKPLDPSTKNMEYSDAEKAISQHIMKRFGKRSHV